MPSTEPEALALAQPNPAETDLPLSIPELAVRQAEGLPLPTPVTSGADLAAIPSVPAPPMPAQAMDGVPISPLQTTTSSMAASAEPDDAPILPATEAVPTTGHDLPLAEDEVDVLAVPALEVPLGL